MKKLLALLMSAAMLTAAMAGCNSTTGSSSNKAQFDPDKTITVISREEGSGTRDAFVELTGVLVKNSDGNKTDNTYIESLIIDGTQAVMSNVSGNTSAVGYISLGSVNNTIKCLKVDGVSPAAETVKDGTYKISRPFNIATKPKPSDATKDFTSYVLSKEGQKVVSDNGYIPIDSTNAYEKKTTSGKVSVSGSSSVSPVMEKIIEAYNLVNSGVTVELQTTDSSSGMTTAIEGSCDIGMASRELKETESKELTATKIALDGIAVIANKSNTTENLTLDQIKGIFTGEITKWSEVQ